MKFKHTLIVKSEKPPIVEYDPECRAAYIKFSNRKIEKTLEQCDEGMVITVDLDKSGGVVGVEAICFDEFSIAQLLQAAKVRTGNIDFSKSIIRTTSRSVRREPVAV